MNRVFCCPTAQPWLFAACVSIALWPVVGAVWAADKEEPVESPGNAEPEVNELIDRVAYLWDQLMSVNARIEVIDEAILRGKGKKVQAKASIGTAERGTDLMDAKGGGPERWSKFYGKAAKDFYFEHTPRGPVKVERPEQFDYLYKKHERHINNARQAIADIAKDASQLYSRRAQLESEQSALWAVIGLEHIQRLGIPQHSLYHWRLQESSPVRLSDGSEMENPRLKVMRSAVLVLRTLDVTAAGGIDRLTEGKQGVYNQPIVYAKLRDAVKNVRGPAEEVAIHFRDTEGADSRDGKKMVVLLNHYKLLESATRNSCDAYQRAVGIDTASEQKLADPQREKLQDAVFNFAGETIRLDSTLRAMADDWKIVGVAGEAYPDEIANPWNSAAAASEPASNPAAASPDVAGTTGAPRESEAVMNLREIRVHKEKKVESHPVVHEAGVAFVVRKDGKKSPLLQQGNSLSWKMIGGQIREVDLTTKMSPDGKRIELIYGAEGQPLPPAPAAAPLKGGNKRGKR